MGYCGRERFYARAALRSQSIMDGPRTFCQCLDSRAVHRRVGLVKMVVTVATWLGAGTHAQNCRGRRGRRHDAMRTDWPSRLTRSCPMS